MNSYELSRNFCNWAFDNPDKIHPNHYAIYFFALEHCNRLGWKNKFGFPSQMTMEAIGIKKHQTYIKYFNDLVDWGFFELVEKSRNQYSANIISIKSAMPKNGKALDKALIKHRAKQTESTGQSTGQSSDSILKQDNKETIEQLNNILLNKDFEFSVIRNLRNFNLSISDYNNHVKIFIDKLVAEDDIYKTVTELKKHFNNWLKQNLKQSTKLKEHEQYGITERQLARFKSIYGEDWREHLEQYQKEQSENP